MRKLKLIGCLLLILPAPLAYFLCQPIYNQYQRGQRLQITMGEVVSIEKVRRHGGYERGNKKPDYYEDSRRIKFTTAAGLAGEIYSYTWYQGRIGDKVEVIYDPQSQKPDADAEVNKGLSSRYFPVVQLLGFIFTPFFIAILLFYADLGNQKYAKLAHQNKNKSIPAASL